MIPTRRYYMPTEYSHVSMLIRDLLLTEPRDPDKESEVYVVSAVADGIGEEPLQVQSLICEGITPYHSFPISGDGYAIYHNKAGVLPDNIDYAIAVMESDAEYRSAGELISAITGTEDFASIKSQILLAVAAGAPWMNLAVGVIGIATVLLKANRDDQLLITMGNLTRGLDYRAKEQFHEQSRYARIIFDVRVW
jgi:hypothetical protein